MPVYKGIVEYFGTNYAGWQRQKNALSIQQVIEDCLNILIKTKVSIIGAGRTDAGVHAKNQVFHFQIENELQLNSLIKSLNAILPKDISVKGIEQVDDLFHARYSAKSRLYKYYITTRKNVFYRNTAWSIRSKINFDKLVEIQNVFLGTKSFFSFCKNSDEIENFTCSVSDSHWERVDDLFIYTIEANRFIHGMVRGIVGCQIEYSKEKLLLNQIENFFNLDSNLKSSKWAPPQGLFLTEVKY